jgi:hypothetical protein
MKRFDGRVLALVVAIDHIGRSLRLRAKATGGVAAADILLPV